MDREQLVSNILKIKKRNEVLDQKNLKKLERKLTIFNPKWLRGTPFR